MFKRLMAGYVFSILASLAMIFGYTLSKLLIQLPSRKCKPFKIGLSDREIVKFMITIHITDWVR